MALVYAQRCESEKDKKLCEGILIASVGIFYVFFAFRGYVYTDWVGYAESYANVTWSDVFEITKPKQGAVIHEPGFTLLMCLCKIFSDEFVFLVVVITTIDVFLLLRFMKRWHIDNIPFVIMLFLIFQGVPLMFNLLRNQISIFIFMNLLQYIEERKARQYFLGCLVALCFHSSSLLFFPLYFVAKVKLNRWLYLGLFIFFFLSYIAHVSFVMLLIELVGLEGVLGEKAVVYTEMFAEATEFSITGTFEKFSLIGLIVCFYDRLTEKKGNVIFINCLLLYMMFYYVLAEFQMMSSRLSMLFVFSFWIVWVELFKLIRIPNNKRVAGVMVFLYGLYSTMLAYPEQIQQYDNVLFGAKSQQQRLEIREKTFIKKL